MVVESISIIIIFAVMVFLFLRAGKKTYAIATLPLIVVPLFEVISVILSEIIGRVVSTDIKSLIVIVGLAISVVFIGLLSNTLKAKKSKVVYMALCGGFTTVLTIIFLYNNYII